MQGIKDWNAKQQLNCSLLRDPEPEPSSKAVPGFFFKNIYIYLFIFDCSGSSLLQVDFL